MKTRILGIETSCDETAVAIIDDDKNIIGQQLYSQIKEHLKYGGVVPEIAARNHIIHLDGLVDKLFAETNLTLNDIDAIAVTAGPGLIGGVISGVMYAKGLAFGSNKPLIAVNHLQGHALTARLTDNVEYPYLLLLVSGGHCQILLVKGPTKFQLLGSTIDDAVGEAFDKVAKMLHLSYPGGPVIEKIAKKGNENKFSLPTPLCDQENCDFSFSGLKTSVSRIIEKNQPNIDEQFKFDLCASFQKTVGDILVNRINNAINMLAIDNNLPNSLVIAGGVAANQYLKNRLTHVTSMHNIKLIAPPIKLCTDNAVMIAWAGFELFQLKQFSNFNLEPKSRWSLEELGI